MNEPRPLGDLVRSLLTRLGLANLETWQRIQEEWEELAGDPWAGRSKPRSLQDGVLVVESSTPAGVSILKYGVASLQSSLNRELGEGVIREVRVKPPPRAGR